jgi:hypothetical protein
MDLIKTTYNLPKDEIAMLQEQFLHNYARAKGWNPNNLTPNQLLEIANQTGYKSPMLLKS